MYIHIYSHRISLYFKYALSQLTVTLVRVITSLWHCFTHLNISHKPYIRVIHILSQLCTVRTPLSWPPQQKPAIYPLWLAHPQKWLTLTALLWRTEEKKISSWNEEREKREKLGSTKMLEKKRKLKPKKISTLSVMSLSVLPQLVKTKRRKKQKKTN